MIQRIPITSLDQWRALRKEDVVTASRAPALFGCHPYVSHLRLYMEACGVEFPEMEDDNPVARRGRLMEATVALAVAEQRPAWIITKAKEYYSDPELRLGATPDFYVTDRGRKGVLQTKTAAPSVYKREWEDGATVPTWIRIQTAIEMMLTGAEFGAVACLKVDAFDLACSVHEIPRDPKSDELIRDAVRRFWDDVANGREPTPDFSRDDKLLSKIAPHETKEKVIDLSGDNQIRSLLIDRAALMDNMAIAEVRKKEIETEIKFKMKDAERIVGIDGWKITWKTHHRKEATVPAQDIRTLRIHGKE